MRSADSLDNMIKNKLKLSASPELDRRIDALVDQPNTQSTQTSTLWRYLMTNRMTQLAAALVITIGLAICLYQSPAYSLEQTIKAYSSIRWLHVKGFTMVGEEQWDSETWIECDAYGKLKRFRHHAYQCTVGNTGGPLTTVHDGEGTDIWWNNSNICIRVSSDVDLHALDCMKVDITETDPKLLFERWLQQQKRGEMELDILEPADPQEPIIAIGLTGDSKTVLTINPVTHLVERMEIYHTVPGQEDRLDQSITFLDYNQPIDPGMFNLKAALPEEITYVDQSDREIGLVQGDMTDEEVAKALTRKLFEAIATRDYDRAGLLSGGAPGWSIKESIPQAVSGIEVLSIGAAQRVGHSNAMHTTADLLVDVMGLKVGIEYDLVRSRPMTRHPRRWVITGLSMRVKPGSEDPYPGKVTLSRDKVHLDAVTYNNPQPGEFMKRWLLLDPIKIELNDSTSSEQAEQIQQDAFTADHIDPTRFEPKLTVDGQPYRWSLLEGSGDKIDLGKVYPGSHQLTYAWAQIDMPQETSAVLGIGFDATVKVWLNGELVHENDVPHPIVVDKDRVPVTFKQGANQLVIKIQNTIWAWGFCCRLLEE